MGGNGSMGAWRDRRFCVLPATRADAGRQFRWREPGPAGLGHAARQPAAAWLVARGCFVLHHGTAAVHAGGVPARAEPGRRARGRGHDVHARDAPGCVAGQGQFHGASGPSACAHRSRHHARTAAGFRREHPHVLTGPHRHVRAGDGGLADPGPCWPGGTTPRTPPGTPLGYVPFIAGAFLGWAAVADTLVLFIGVLPLAGVCAIRACQAMVVERKPLASQWYDMALGAAALLGAAAGVLALHVIHAHGGFYMPAPSAQLAQSGATLVRNLGIAAQGLLLLGGADFLGLRLTASTVFTMLHVVGVFLAAWGTWLAARRFLRDRDLVAQLLVTGVAINWAAYVLSTKANVITQTREIAVVLPFSAALAGRLLAGRLNASKLVPLLLVVLLGYLVGQ